MEKLKNGGITGVMFAVIKGVLFFFISVMLFAALFYLFSVKESYIPICYNGIVFLSSFLVGIWSSKGKNSKGYLRGLFGGISFVVLFMVFSRFFGDKSIVSAAVTYFIMVLIAICGGIIGVNVNN